MGWSVGIAPEQDKLVVAGTGEISEEDARAQIGEVVRLLKEHPVSAILVDYSEALSEVSLSGAYRLPDYYAALDGPWQPRVAVVTPRTGYRLETYHFLELVCRNAGYDVKTFDARDAAEDWLLQSSRTPGRADHCLAP